MAVKVTRFAKVCRESGWSYPKLSALTGLSKARLSRLGTGRYEPRAPEAVAISRAMGRSALDLFPGLLNESHDDGYEALKAFVASPEGRALYDRIKSVVTQ